MKGKLNKRGIINKKIANKNNILYDNFLKIFLFIYLIISLLLFLDHQQSRSLMHVLLFRPPETFWQILLIQNHTNEEKTNHLL